MYGNTPHAGESAPEPTVEEHERLRQDLTDVAASTRSLLSDDFVVGGEINDNDSGLHATVAVQPPVGGVVSTGFAPEDDNNRAEIAHKLAAGAVLAAKQANADVPPVAR
ncbi:MAG: DUF5811 family protein [Natronomonas sp.]